MAMNPEDLAAAPGCVRAAANLAPMSLISWIIVAVWGGLTLFVWIARWRKVCHAIAL
jgi:hypothetical protein